jgi:uncharacterized protein YbaP (TraB family)
MRRPFDRLAAAAVLVFSALALLAPPASAAPGWWRVSNGHSEVWVLGVPAIAPKDLAWDTASVEKRLAGAHQLIVGVQSRNGLQAMGTLMTSALSTTPMENGLSPQLRRRFDAASAIVGKDPKHYQHWKPGVAGVMLAGDYYKAEDLKAGGVESTVRKLARKAGVTETPADTYNASDMAAGVEKLSPQGQQICLGATLMNVENGAAARLRANATAWAKGEPQQPPPTSADLECVAAMPGVKALNDHNLAAEAGAVANALNAPGRTLAVFDLQRMTMSGGILERLRARGLSVSGPLP